VVADTYVAADLTVDTTGRITVATGHTTCTPDGVIAGGDLSGNWSAPVVSALTSDATKLTIGAIADNQLLKRSANTIIGGNPTPTRVATDGNDLGVFLFSDVSGTTTFDSTGSEVASFVVDAASGGGTIVAGAATAPFGTALSVDLDRTARTADGAFDPTAAITVSCWVRVRTLYNGGVGRIVYKSAKPYPTFGSPWVPVSLQFQGTDDASFLGCPAFYIRIGSPGSTGYTAKAVKPIVLAGDWVHMGGTYDGANVKLYVNGRLIATTAATGPINHDANGPWVIGAAPSGTDQGFDGWIHDLRIADAARALSWFQTVYQQGTGGKVY
jgi:hypothetical protein